MAIIQKMMDAWEAKDRDTIDQLTHKEFVMRSHAQNMEFSKFFNGVPTGKEIVPSSDKDVELEFLKILNKARVENGLNPLKLDYDLCMAARYHSYDMGSQNYFDHTSFRPSSFFKFMFYIFNSYFF